VLRFFSGSPLKRSLSLLFSIVFYVISVRFFNPFWFRYFLILLFLRGIFVVLLYLRGLSWDSSYSGKTLYFLVLLFILFLKTPSFCYIFLAPLYTLWSLSIWCLIFILIFLILFFIRLSLRAGSIYRRVRIFSLCRTQFCKNWGRTKFSVFNNFHAIYFVGCRFSYSFGA